MSAIEEDDDGSVIEIDEDTNEENNPPRLIVDSLPIPIVTPPRPSNESRDTPIQCLVDTHYLSLNKKNIRGTFSIEILPVAKEKKKTLMN